MEPNKENQAQHLLVVEYTGIGSDSCPLYYSRSASDSKVGFDKYTLKEFRPLVNEIEEARAEGCPFDPLPAPFQRWLEWTGPPYE